jgi:hypothetical protein
VRPGGSELIDLVARAGGPRLRVVRRLDGGGNAGAWEVERDGGGRSALTCAGVADPAQPGMLGRAIDLVERAIAAGVPAPRWEEVVPLPDGDVAVLQELVPGVKAEWVGERWCDTMLELAERRRGLLAGTAYETEVSSLHLREPATGYCEHASLERHDDRTRRLLAAILDTGAPAGADDLCGADVVHYDHHRGNVLVATDDADRVVAIVDWGGARGGSVAFDLVCLAADLERWWHPHLAARIDAELEQTCPADDLRRFRAHAALRYVDWMLRHSPDLLDGWLTIAERYVLG